MFNKLVYNTQDIRSYFSVAEPERKTSEIPIITVLNGIQGNALSQFYDETGMRKFSFPAE